MIREKLQRKLGVAFDGKLSDAVNPFTARYSVTTGYDPVTEQGVTETLTYAGRGVLANYSLERIDGVNILSGDLELVALTNEVSGQPAIGHTITAPDLVTGKPQIYSVVRTETDPTASVYSIQLRRA